MMRRKHASHASSPWTADCRLHRMWFPGRGRNFRVIEEKSRCLKNALRTLIESKAHFSRSIACVFIVPVAKGLGVTWYVVNVIHGNVYGDKALSSIFFSENDFITRRQPGGGAISHFRPPYMMSKSSGQSTGCVAADGNWMKSLTIWWWDVGYNFKNPFLSCALPLATRIIVRAELDGYAALMLSSRLPAGEYAVLWPSTIEEET